MGNELLRELSLYWCMFHVALIFVMLFRSRFSQKKSLILVGAGIGALMILNGIGLAVLGNEMMGKLLLLTCSLPSLIYFWVLSRDRNGKFLLTFCLADTSCLWVLAVTNLLDTFLGGKAVRADVHKQADSVPASGIHRVPVFQETLLRASGDCGQRFQELEVNLHLDIQVGEEALPYMELCRILSNGLENAWEASAELPARERAASVQMKYSRDYLLIRVKNKCRGDLSVEKGTLPKSNKEEPGHGFGLATIQEAAAALGGEMLAYTDSGNFVLDVMVRSKCFLKTE